jgi:hypothetical protein
MERFTCDWIFNILVVNCDGKVVCGCADPNGERPLGHLKDQSILEIWNSEKVREIRAGLNRGLAPFCLNCGLRRTLPPGEEPPQRSEKLDVLPRIFLEPTILCNLSCHHAVCARGSGILQTRSRKFFPLDEFKELMTSAGPNLIRLDLFNYGEPFVHPQAVEMIEFVKRRYPHVYLYVSTNGLMLDEEKIRRLAASGLDEITFSVDGADQKTYERYRIGGDLKRLIGLMSAFVAERNRLGREVPFINWRYILFRWNDSRGLMNRARRLAARIGVDRLTWEITDHPADAVSTKFVPGAAALRPIRHEIWDTSQIGTAIRGKRYEAGIRPGRELPVMPAGKPLKIRVRVRNQGGALWLQNSFSGRRIVRLGAQLHDGDRRMIDLNYARAFLPESLAKGETADIDIELPAVAAPGDYWLKFDMVSEGIDWFESGGSPVVWRRLRVLRA